MAQQLIYFGDSESNNGDTLYDAFTKVNLNIVDLQNTIIPSWNALLIDTYAEMLEISTPVQTELLVVKVLNDENKGITNTIYHLYPDGTRMWIAAVEDN
jgi:hypothetical protein